MTSELGLLILLMQRSVGCVLSHFYMQLGKSGSALTVQTGSRDQINILTDNSKVKIKLEMSFIYKPAASLDPIRHHSYS
ncbi:hypothetical protein NOF04DRAFT_11941 [Fusarium oxysporum II5]|uniref:Secreted protein n=2 Tax=Fusarium oxysporum species complex TaxID=171631 RepID=X0KFP6_FUSO5|nr:uncharacterized protein FOIG_02517 [Fusarium odoratissimum NRRL 54006]EXM07511.1 hypothetical protein FOIG_02517 [Fusarium odoratissimum NRRL 54006]KAK2130782.1 hypothetical protein NOF04DRAFT_11941 [Fusarium oxysporum II5]TXC10419.1 hypothetical protein FocTR4_00004624 [Fusarium oxysporum f. sp. cubense]